MGTIARRRFGALALVVGLVFAATGCDDITIIDRTNALRATKGAAPLELNAELWVAAGKWSQKMAADGRLSHSDVSSGVTTPWTKLGENVAYATTLDGAWHQLVNSTLHYNTMMEKGYTHIGVGVYQSGGYYWVTMQFMKAA